MKTKLLLGLLLMCSGCASVPSTRVSLPTPLGLLQIDSPKETSWTNVVIEIGTNGVTKASIGAVSAHNDANVIAAVAAANAAMADRVIAIGGKLIEAGAKAAVPVP